MLSSRVALNGRMWLPTHASARLRHPPFHRQTSTEVDWDAELRKLNAKQTKGVSETEVTISKFQKKVR